MKRAALVLPVLVSLLAAGCGDGPFGGKRDSGKETEKLATNDGISRGCYFAKGSAVADSFAEKGVSPAAVCIQFYNDMKVDDAKCQESGGEVRQACSTEHVAIRCKATDGNAETFYYAGWQGECPQ